MVKFTQHRAPVVSTAAILLALSVASCGRPATAEDCERIVTRITELELEEANVSDPGNIAAQIEDTKKRFSEAAAEECVGRRISQRSLDCVEAATSARQIVEECFD